MSDLWFEPEGDFDLRTVPPLALAYVGDAVFELFIRLQLVSRGGSVQKLHQNTVRFVRASAQKDILRQWQPLLTETERRIVRRGRNAKSTVPRSSDVSTYRHSTGLEALVGYLYLSGEQERLLLLLETIHVEPEEES